MSEGAELAQGGVRARVYIPCITPLVYACASAESREVKVNTPEAVLIEGHCKGGESQKRCIPKFTVGKLLAEVLFSVNPKSAALLAWPLPFEVTIRASACDVVCCGDAESATWILKVNVPACVVVPESDPADCTVIPPGRVPEPRLQL